MAIRSMLPELWRGERGGVSPLREMNRLQRRLDRMFDEFFYEPLPGLSRSGREFPLLEEAEFAPACDVEETDNHFILTVDLPGIKKDDVKIDLRDHHLIVSGERKEEAKGRLSRERFYGAFSRTFTLPQNVKLDKIEANYENGVLQIAVPKAQVSEGKHIPIKEGKLIEGKQAEKKAEKQEKGEKAA